MNKIFKTAFFAILLLSVILLTACGGEVVKKGECLVVVASQEGITEYKISLSEINGNEGLFTLLVHLKSENKLDFSEKSGPFGKYLLSVGDIKPASNGEYIKLFTSCEGDFDVSAYAEYITYKDTPLCTSGVGASSMKIEDGGIYYITLGSF